MIPKVLTGEKIKELSGKKSLAKLWPAKNKGEKPQAAEKESFSFVGNRTVLVGVAGEYVVIEDFFVSDDFAAVEDFDMDELLCVFDCIDELDIFVVTDIKSFFI